MTREESRKAAEVMLAYADGKDLQIGGQGSNEWVDVTIPVFNWELNSYRVKPETTYRPFKDAKECFEEMQKHQPFGWITLQCGQKSGSKASIIKLTDNCFYFVGDGSGICHNLYNYEFDKHFWLFADGTPFGIKVEEE